MARWTSMTTVEQMQYLAQRFEEIKSAQRLLGEFERLTSSQMDKLSEKLKQEQGTK